LLIAKARYCCSGLFFLQIAVSGALPQNTLAPLLQRTTGSLFQPVFVVTKLTKAVCAFSNRQIG
jgi:hypothetical protein